jgi:hypothetical protein
LDSLFFDPKSGFNTGKGFRNKARENEYDRKHIQQYIDRNDIAQRFLPRRKSSDYYLPILNLDRNSTWEADLIDFSTPYYTSFNHRYKYILVVIDQATRYVWTQRLFKKSASLCKRAFKTIIDESGAKPDVLITDKGGEFKGAFKQYIQGLDIEHVTHFEHANHAERVNRTLKGMLGRYFEANNTRKWLDVYTKITYNYNHKIHSSLKETPYRVYYNPDVSERVRDYQNKQYVKRWKHVKMNLLQLPKLKVGDNVRLEIKGKFRRSYQPNWSTDIYPVTEVYKSYYFRVNGKRYQRCQLLKVDKEKLITNQKAKQTRKQLAAQIKKARQERRNKRDGIEVTPPNNTLQNNTGVMTRAAEEARKIARRKELEKHHEEFVGIELFSETDEQKKRREELEEHHNNRSMFELFSTPTPKKKTRSLTPSEPVRRSKRIHERNKKEKKQ